ncbi:uncharacterized protein BT62DRAFT_1004189 [Guyanagaster necrorhizus]|uniref:Uncharacterized protein n=1 Tax=Guyanagaster necrorhizus TaxID=856835 RepID=A0A9P8ATI6_9AGAR|nr:uncharacterized protein BT62DRAFT_1004189 [Guyanagaster necrorhizus MCA 3950]KAG7447454.1 hypothetical protein BT62DRAFT_1004189 [Guyanagaster necrorhizus MCA 3950]
MVHFTSFLFTRSERKIRFLYTLAGGVGELCFGRDNNDSGTMLSHYKHDVLALRLRNREAFGLPHFSMTSIQEANIPPLDESEVRNWVQYWRQARRSCLTSENVPVLTSTGRMSTIITRPH